MQATLRIKNAIYTNGRYYVHGYHNKLGGAWTITAMKRGQFRRSPGTLINHVTTANYYEAVQLFDNLVAQVKAIIANAAAKRSAKSDARKTAIAAFKASTPNPWKVGDLCHTSWGYDQTNVDAFQVVEIKSRTTIVVRPIGGDVEATGPMQGRFTPIKDQFTGQQPITVVAGFSYWPHATSGNGCAESWAVNGHNLYETKPGQSHHFSSYA